MLRALRIEKGLTQVDLAARLGLPQSYVSKYETGERRVDFVETSLICDALGIGIESFAARFIAQKRIKVPRSKPHLE